MWGICPILGARPNQGAVGFNAASPDARRCARESPIVRVACLVGPGQFTKFGTRIPDANRSSCDPAAAPLDSATVAARRRPACRVISAFSDNSYAGWSTRTGDPGTLDTLPSAPPSLRSPARNIADARGGCTIGDSKCPSRSRQNVGSRRRQDLRCTQHPAFFQKRL